MQEETVNSWEGRPMKMFGILLPSLPSLTIRLAGTFLRFKKNAQRAEKVFKKELIKQGIDKQTANDLTEKYMEGSKIQKYFLSNVLNGK
jgi:hypothetical protein